MTKKKETAEDALGFDRDDAVTKLLDDAIAVLRPLQRFNDGVRKVPYCVGCGQNDCMSSCALAAVLVAFDAGSVEG